jgi:hypothetical protein
MTLDAHTSAPRRDVLVERPFRLTSPTTIGSRWWGATMVTFAEPAWHSRGSLLAPSWRPFFTYQRQISVPSPSASWSIGSPARRCSRYPTDFQVKSLADRRCSAHCQSLFISLATGVVLLEGVGSLIRPSDAVVSLAASRYAMTGTVSEPPFQGQQSSGGDAYFAADHLQRTGQRLGSLANAVPSVFAAPRHNL